MSQNLKMLSVPKNLKVRVTCLFLRGEPTVWFEWAAQPQLYRWNKFRSSLERNFGSHSADWKRRMVKEFGNNTDDSKEGGLGRCEGAGPSSALGRDTRDSGSDSSNPEEDPKEDIDGTKTQSGV